MCIRDRYYLVFLILPNIFFLYNRHFRSNFIHSEKSPSFLNILILASSALSAFILCSPYLLNMLVLLQATYHRAGENLAFSTSNSFTFRESIGALIFPPSANIEGVYYFGAINVLLIGIYFLNQIWPIIRAKKSKLSRDSITTLVLLFIWIIIINDFTFQERSFIFMAFWNYPVSYTHLTLPTILRV